MSEAKTIKTIGEEIIDGLKEIQEALKAGTPLEQLFTVRTVAMPLWPQTYEPEDVKRVRGLIKASQPLFAALLGVNINTVRSWEQGKRVPSTMARRFMDELAFNPSYWQERLKNAFATTNHDPH